jgi:hypothetical protein
VVSDREVSRDAEIKWYFVGIVAVVAGIRESEDELGFTGGERQSEVARSLELLVGARSEVAYQVVWFCAPGDDADVVNL